MVHRSRFVATLLLAGSLTGAVACSREEPRADEALLIRPGVTSGGTGMGGVEPTPSIAHGDRSVSLGTTYHPSAGAGAAPSATTVRTDANGNTVTVISGPTPQPASTVNGATPNGATAGTPVGTVNGNYGPLPSTGVDPTTTAPPNAGVITH